MDMDMEDSKVVEVGCVFQANMHIWMILWILKDHAALYHLIAYQIKSIGVTLQ